MNNLKRGLVKSFGYIKKHQLLFLLAVFLQVLLIIFIGMIFVHFQQKIFAETQYIMTSMENANFDTDKLQAGEAFIPEMSAVYDSYNGLVKNIWGLILSLGSLFIFWSLLIWLLLHFITTDITTEKKISWKNYCNIYISMTLKYLLSTIVYLGGFFLLTILILKVLFSGGLIGNYSIILGKILLGLFLIVYFVMLVFLSQINVKSWKEFFKKGGLLLSRRFHLVLLVLIINLIFVIGSFMLIYWAIFNLSSTSLFSLLLILLTILVFNVVLVLTKIYWIACLRELVKES